MYTKLSIGRDYMKDKIKRKIKAMNKLKTFASWMVMTNILYIISVYVGNKIIASSNDLFMILYDVVVTIGILCIIYMYISKTIAVEKILKAHYKMFLFLLIVLIIFNKSIQKFILYNPAIYNAISWMPYETFHIIVKFISANLQLGIIYILFLQKE